MNTTERLRDAAQAAFNALKSYEYGNASPDLAKEACKFLQDALAETRQEPPAPGLREPDGYAHVYHGHNGADVVSFNQGEEVNGSKPFKCLAYYFEREPAATPAQTERERVIEECAKIAMRTPFRPHREDDIDFHSGCVQTRERIVDAIRALAAEKAQPEGAGE